MTRFRASRGGWRHGALLALCLTCLPAALWAEQIPSWHFPPPPTGDFFGEWIKFRLRSEPSADPLLPGYQYMEAMVVAPFNPYTVLRWDWFPQPGSPLEGQALYGAMGTTRPGTVLSRKIVTRMIQWDLGHTKAIPGLQAPYGAEHPEGSSRSQANLMKAGVRSLYANKMRHLAGDRFPAVMANYAVALQILRDKTDEITPTGRATVGLRAGVLHRVMLADSIEGLNRYDMYYLAKLVQAEMSGGRNGDKSTFGYRQLPTALRVARVAAAYRDAQRRSTDPDPCAHLDSPQGNSRAELLDNLCTTEATDMNVHEWYHKELKRELAMDVENEVDAQQLGFLVGEVARIRPIWNGPFERHVQLVATNPEITELLAAYRNVEADSENPAVDRYIDRANELLCTVY